MNFSRFGNYKNFCPSRVNRKFLYARTSDIALANLLQPSVSCTSMKYSILFPIEQSYRFVYYNSLTTIFSLQKGVACNVQYSTCLFFLF